MIQRFSTTASGEPGNGTLICQCYDNKTKFSKIHAQYPLKFIPTKGHADRLAVVYMISYGGGIVSGDQFQVQIDILPKAILLLLTQGNTKIFKDPSSTATTTIQNKNGKKMEDTSTQTIKATISAGGILINMPDPVTSFKDSSFTSKQIIHLQDNTSQLVLLDWFTSGRMSRGEQWQFKYYASRIDIYLDQKLKIKDHMVLEDSCNNNNGLEQQEEENDRNNDDDDKETKETSYAAKLKPYACFATLIIIASDHTATAEKKSPLYQSIHTILKKSEDMRMLPHSMKKEKDLLWSVSPCLNDRGVLIRMAGMTTEMVRDFIKLECLGQGLKDIVGDGMFGKILM
ncbi:UreD urease accessory protein-domain-containing protein [Cunninghamella echinulata]|nr:UreD urease accessory protein-domain-containing protein [Cunninghamella echinulata]